MPAKEDRYSRDVRGAMERMAKGAANAVGYRTDDQIVFENATDKTVLVVLAQTAFHVTESKARKGSAKVGAGTVGVGATLGLEVVAGETKSKVELLPLFRPIGSGETFSQRVERTPYYLSLLTQRSSCGYRVHAENVLLNGAVDKGYNILPRHLENSYRSIKGVHQVSSVSREAGNKKKSNESSDKKKKKPVKKANSDSRTATNAKKKKSTSDSNGKKKAKADDDTKKKSKSSSSDAKKKQAKKPGNRSKH